jgi:hypothetical protein
LTDIKPIPNMELGSIWAAWLLAELAKNWPIPRDLSYDEVLQATKVGVETGMSSDAFLGLMRFLEDEGFVRITAKTMDGSMKMCRLTEKSMVRLNHLPEGLGGRSLKGSIVQAASDVAKEGAKSQMAELFGQFIGGATKALSS